MRAVTRWSQEPHIGTANSPTRTLELDRGAGGGNLLRAATQVRPVADLSVARAPKRQSASESSFPGPAGDLPDTPI
jgi:hypothetical protein